MTNSFNLSELVDKRKDVRNTEEKFLDLLDKEIYTAKPIDVSVMERAAKIKAKGDAAKRRATAKDVEAAAMVGNLQMKFFEENGRFPTDEEVKGCFIPIEEARNRRNYGKFEKEPPFSYNLEEMEKGLNSGSETVPKFETFEEFNDWIEEK